jgi:hypothetical protein
MRTILVLCIALMLANGCAPRERVVTVGEATNAAMDEPTSLTYVGSDADFHYIDHQTKNGKEQLRVHRSELILPNVFPLGQGQPYRLNAADLKPAHP